jgi:hypothetical protein
MTDQTKHVSFRLPRDMVEALETIKERDGIPASEQVRRALKLWFAEKLRVPKKKGGR